MLYRGFSNKARNAVTSAMMEASRRATPEVSLGHLALGIFQEGDQYIYEAFHSCKLTTRTLSLVIMQHLPIVIKENVPLSHVQLSPETKHALEEAKTLSQKRNNSSVTLAHLLHALIVPDSDISEALRACEVTPENVLCDLSTNYLYRIEHI